MGIPRTCSPEVCGELELEDAVLDDAWYKERDGKGDIDGTDACGEITGDNESDILFQSDRAIPSQRSRVRGGCEGKTGIGE